MDAKQMKKLFAGFATIKTCSIENFNRLKATVSMLPIKDVEQLADSDIPFVNTAANSVLVDKGVRDEDARIDHCARILCQTQSTKAAI